VGIVLAVVLFAVFGFVYSKLQSLIHLFSKKKFLTCLLLSQDERVMQLFGLVNTLLANDRETSKSDLHIRGYSVIPLAPNSGLIQWLPNCDTLHALIKEYRDAKHVLLNIEVGSMSFTNSCSHVHTYTHTHTHTRAIYSLYHLYS
jgi:hypothetical protein